MKTVKILSLTLLMSIFCAGISFAQQQGQRGQKPTGTPEERAAKRVEMMKKSLDLTPAQVTKLQPVMTQFAKEKAAAKDNPQEMKAKKAAYDAQLKSILTPAQYQKYQEQRKEMKKGGNQHGKCTKGNHQGKQGGNKKGHSK